MDPIVVSREARQVHDAALVVDLHNDMLLGSYFLGWDWHRRHAPNPLPGAPLLGHSDLPRLREGNVGAVAFGVVTSPLRWRGGTAAIHRDLDALAAEVARSGGTMEIAGSAQAIRAARASGRVAAFAGLEGAHGLHGRLDELGAFRAKGLRYVGLVHFTANAAGRPMVGLGADNGAPLPAFGRDLLGALGDHRMICDAAHLGKAAVLEACRLAPGRVIVSHTGCTAVYPSPRGIDDEVLRAVADADGVVGMIFVTPFIGRGGARAVARHLDHVRRTVGARHCAIGTDWEGFALYPSDLDSAEKLPNLTQALLDIGWSTAEIHAAYGENVLRVFERACG
ncbi:MAG: membrane dipeptidase [Deltaproteobacteria bacterium]|nr:membrane dipeptidase [Deltaproteobacteria bacterium]